MPLPLRWPGADISAAKQSGSTGILKTGSTIEMLNPDLSKKWFEVDPACFVAGTLVHTKEGLKPIEQIKVGDWVLSKHESGQDYKRVTKTFVHDDAQVTLLSYRVRPFDPNGPGGFLIVTPDHPFWVPGKGWKNAETLKHTFKGMPLETFDGKPMEVSGNTNLYITASKSIAWLPDSNSDLAPEKRTP